MRMKGRTSRLWIALIAVALCMGMTVALLQTRGDEESSASDDVDTVPREPATFNDATMSVAEFCADPTANQEAAALELFDLIAAYFNSTSVKIDEDRLIDSIDAAARTAAKAPEGFKQPHLDLAQSATEVLEWSRSPVGELTADDIRASVLAVLDSFELTCGEYLAQEAATKAAQAASALPPGQWQFTCGGVVYESLADVWAARAARGENWVTCNITSRAGAFAPNELQSSTINAVTSASASIKTPVEVFAAILGVCVYEDVRPHQLSVSGFNIRSLGVGAVTLCPEAPHRADLDLLAAGRLFGPGRYLVGTDIPAGTYRSQPGVSDCYWERATGSGETIDNEFVTFAGDGAVVTVRSGEYLIVEAKCGTWRG